MPRSPVSLVYLAALVRVCVCYVLLIVWYNKIDLFHETGDMLIIQ